MAVIDEHFEGLSIKRSHSQAFEKWFSIERLTTNARILMLIWFVKHLCSEYEFNPCGLRNVRQGLAK